MQRRLSLFRSAVPRAAVATLTALVLAACNDAVRKVDEISNKTMSGMLGGMGLPPGLF